MGQLKRRGRVFWIRYYRNGARHEESANTRKKGEALALLQLREGAIAQGAPVSAKLGRVRFEDAVADVVRDYQINGKRSIDGVQRRIDLHLLPWFGGQRLAQITTADLRRYASKRLGDRTLTRRAYQRKTKNGVRTVLEHTRPIARVSNAEINRELAIVKRAFRLAAQSGRLMTVPYVPMLKENNVRQGFFERGAFEAVRAHLPASLRGAVTVAFWTGWRIRSEVLSMQWAQIDRTAKIIRIDPGNTKGGEGRTLPYDLLPELVEVIDRAWQEHERLQHAGRITPFVFHRDGARILDYRSAWINACRAAGIAGKVPHDFRRSAVRNFERAGVPRSVAMKITGHKTESVYRRYAIVNEADLRDGLGRLAAHGATHGARAAGGLRPGRK